MSFICNRNFYCYCAIYEFYERCCLRSQSSQLPAPTSNWASLFIRSAMSQWAQQHEWGHESSASLQLLTFEYLTQKVNTDLRSQSFIEQKRCESYLYLCAIIFGVDKVNLLRIAVEMQYIFSIFVLLTLFFIILISFLFSAAIKIYYCCKAHSFGLVPLAVGGLNFQ